MPNWNLSHGIRTFISQRANLLSDRALHYALADFPLTTAQVQDIVLPEDQLSAMRKLDAAGVRTIEHHTQIRLAFLKDQLPEIRRSVVVVLQLPNWIFVGRGTTWGVSTTKFTMDDTQYLVPDLSKLDADVRASLVIWIERATRQARLDEIVQKSVAEVIWNKQLEAVSRTAAHLQAFWPMLTTLTSGAQTNDPLIKTWEERFRNPTRSLKAYMPERAMVDKFRRVIIAADTVLTMGKVLEPYKHPSTVVRAQIEHWEPRDGDLTYPICAK